MSGSRDAASVREMLSLPSNELSDGGMRLMSEWQVQAHRSRQTEPCAAGETLDSVDIDPGDRISWSICESPCDPCAKQVQTKDSIGRSRLVHAH